MTQRLVFASVVLDVDSTLCGIEGIDVLAARKGPEIGAAVAAVTERAMNGELELDAIYGERLALIRPTRDDLQALADTYAANVAPDAPDVVRQLRADGVRLALVSGGIRQAIEPLARSLGFVDGEINAVTLELDDAGSYRSSDRASPLTRQTGSARIVEPLGLTRPILAVGDGSTDVSMREVTDAFAAYVEFARREPVVAAADFVVTSFAEVAILVRTGRAPLRSG